MPESNTPTSPGDDVFIVRIGDDEVCRTSWPVLAQAAWHRATRDRAATQEGLTVSLLKNDVLIETVEAASGVEHHWPDPVTEPVSAPNMVNALYFLFRKIGVDRRALADAMTQKGLPTSVSRLRALTESGRSQRNATSNYAELVVMLAAAADLANSAQEQVTQAGS